MAAQKGKDLLLKVAGEANNGFVTVAGMRSRRLSFNAETVDATDSASTDRWRELLAGAGVRRASIAGSGIFKDAASDERVRTLFFEGEIVDWSIIVPDFGTVAGKFQIASLEYAGEHNGEVTFEMSLESAGPLTFAALA
ncbi:MAG: phage major tail protein, TP901-1 family [Pseudomonadota bacterium]